MYCVHLAPGVSVSQVGAKAANLGKAKAFGLRVPTGFVVTRNALSLFLNEMELCSRVCELLEQSGRQNRVLRKRDYEELCADVIKSPVPKALQEEVAQLAILLLQSTPLGLAIRSSGICEDTVEASFAGVYESFLSVNSLEKLWESIRLCWCSSWSPSAIDYGRKMGIEVQPDHMAVIVQELVAADAAGVIFTADPNTGNPWHFVLSSTFGLAQNVMNSTAPADSFVLEWDTSKIISKRIVEKPTMLIPGKAGIKRAQLSSERGKDASLSDAMSQRISDMALSLDRLFNLRVDVEWAVLGEDIYLIQVRPLTALPEFFPISLSEEDMKLYWGYEPNDGSDNSSLATGTDIPYEPFFRGFYTSEMDTRYVFYGDVALAHFEEKVIEIHGYQFISGWKYVPPSLDRHSFEKWLYDNEPKLKASWLKAKQKMQESANRAAKAIESTCSAADIIPHLLRMRELYWDATAANLGLSHMLYHSCHDLLLHFVNEVAPDFFADGLLQGLISYSHEHAQVAYKLGQNISEDFVKDAFAECDFDEIIPYLLENHRECRFLKDYEKFCWRFGLRPPNWSFRAARWARFQEGIVFQGLPVIKNALLGRSRNPEEVFRDAVRRREANEQEIRRLILEREPSQLRRLNKLLDWAQFWTAALDDITWIMIPHHSLFELVWETGVRFHKEGLIDKPEETLLFTVADLKQIQKAKEPEGLTAICDTI